MEATSRAYVCGLTPTIRSMASRRPTYPFSFTRISYQVGRPCIFDGKICLEEMGIPIRKIDRANNSFALADPVPFTLAKDRKSTRLNSSHVKTSYAVFCLKKTMLYATP